MLYTKNRNTRKAETEKGSQYTVYVGQGTLCQMSWRQSVPMETNSTVNKIKI